MSVVWQDPPITGQRSKHPWDEIIRELRTHPGKWALVLEGTSPSMRYSPRLRDCEVRAVSTDVHNKVNIYARWPVG